MRRPANASPDTADRSHVAVPLLLCVPRPLMTPFEKREARRRTGADLVDMESAAVARHAEGRGERFLWIKAISDTAAEPLPAWVVEVFGAQGEIDGHALLQAILRRPLDLLSAAVLLLRARRLSRRLADALFDFLHDFEDVRSW